MCFFFFFFFYLLFIFFLLRRLLSSYYFIIVCVIIIFFLLLRSQHFLAAHPRRNPSVYTYYFIITSVSGRVAEEVCRLYSGAACVLMSLICHPIILALEQVQEWRKSGLPRPIIHTDPANQVEASDVVLHNLFSYFTRDTFLAIPLVCKRWRNFRTEALWKNRLLRDFDLDLSSLKKEPNVLLLYKQMFAAKNDIYRKSRYFDIKPENLVLPRRLFRTYST